MKTRNIREAVVKQDLSTKTDFPADLPPGLPQYQRIKTHVLAQVQRGHWKEGDVIPAEERLAIEFGVSRMTVNRAIRELTAEGVLSRRQGAGTYVAQHKYQATLVQIQSIAEEVRARGHRYSSALHLLEAQAASKALAADFALRTRQRLFHSIIVHFDNEVPIQVEDRWTNARVAPDYLGQNFSETTPNEYLMRVAPLQGVTYSIEALSAPAFIAQMLDVAQDAPCLVLHRKTFSFDQVASIATMWYPGSRYQFEGRL